MGSESVILWNSAGLRASTDSTAAKFAFFDSQFSNAKFSIAAFVETHHKDDQDFTPDFGQFEKTHNIIHSPATNETHSGIIVLISTDYEIVGKSDPLPGRILNVRLTKLKKGLNLTIFYGPQWGKMKKDEIADVLGKFDGLHDPHDCNIILGDFNFVDFDIDKGKKMTGKDQMIKPIWEHFLGKNALVDPFRVQCPNKRIYSFTSAQGKSRGDRLYISEANLSAVKNLRYINTPFKTAHKIMTFNLQTEQKFGPSSWKMNSSVVRDQRYRNEIEEIYNDLNTLDISNPVDWWDLFITVVQGVTIAYTTRKARIKHALKNFLLQRIESLEEKEALDKSQKKLYSYYKQRLDEIFRDEINGHHIRTKGQPTYELNEPDISTYSKFEKRYQAKSVIHQLADDKGNIHSDNETLLKISEQYYTKLFTSTKTNSHTQNRLLQNVATKISAADKKTLDAPLTLEELEKAVMALLSGKSPGPDGISAEFYKAFWYLIKDRFLLYINTAKQTGFHAYRNESTTTIIYKRKGEVYKLEYYRPIALMNVDIKILTKTLNSRLRPILPSIIHYSQTAVQGRRIDYTVHMIRDLVDLINKEDSEGALIFLDQEKAFDRVEHEFLFKVMTAFGFGESFIDWIRVLYANASTKVKLNGYYTNSISLNRGLRQGCPLSPSLYVLIIELFALLLRNNPNIVGFKVGGEKIVSMHYADDATIVIKQNKCFKEVIKEIQFYEQASGARVNVEKTKGLWIGKWKTRTDSPLGFTWTNENVKTLGVYFGNTNPAEITFNDIVPKVKRSMNYWKQFHLSKFGKSRIVEIFHASRLWYASTFYPIPENLTKDLQASFKDYINFPRQKRPTVSEAEMKKLRLHGGIKLIDIQTKVQTSRCMWLLDLLHNKSLSSNLAVATTLVGTQKGGLQLVDIVFTNTFYCNKLLQIPNSSFYLEGLKATAKLTLSKRIDDLNEEKIFYNPIFTDVHGKPLAITKRCEKQGIFHYRTIAQEYTKKALQVPYRAYVSNIFDKIARMDIAGKSQHTIFITSQQARISFGVITHKILYEELLRHTYLQHHSVEKWENKFDCEINWEKVWESINNPVTSEEVKTTIWEQVHLNDYCTYNYNKWHNKQELCPLCLELPQTKFHLTLDCKITQNLWAEIEPHLTRLFQQPVSNEEKIFGIVGNSPGVILRNWLTFLLRHCVVEQERIGYHNKLGCQNELELKIKFNERAKSEVMAKYRIYANLGRTEYFEKIFAFKDYLLVWEDNWYQMLTLYQI